MIINFLDTESIKKNRSELKNGLFDLLIFFGLDLESILISRILSTFFQNKFISYELCPVHSWEKFNNRCKKISNQKLNFLQIFLINFGGNINLKKFLDKNNLTFINIFVFHPITVIHRKNVISKQIFVFNNKSYWKCHLENIITKSCLKSNLFRNLPTKTQIFSNFLLRTKKEKLESFWFQVISISNLHFSKKIDDETYSKEMKILEQILRKHFKKKNPKILSNDSNFYKVEPSVEISSSLLRHWSIFESMTNTPRLFSYFCLWKKSGIKKISKYFLKMGFSMKEANIYWNLLSFEKKKKFKNNFQNELNRFGIHNLKFNSFVKTYLFENSIEKFKNQKISAQDCIYGLNSLFDFGINEYKKKKKKQKDLIIASRRCMHLNL